MDTRVIARPATSLTAVLGAQPPVPASSRRGGLGGGRAGARFPHPGGVPDGPDQPVFFDIHGGGLIMGGVTARRHGQEVAAMVRLPVWSVDYRMPPDHPIRPRSDDC